MIFGEVYIQCLSRYSTNIFVAAENDTIHDALIALAQSLEVKNGTLLWPVRIAAAGQTVTPGGAMEILAVLGKEEALRRLQLGLQKIENA